MSKLRVGLLLSLGSTVVAVALAYIYLESRGEGENTLLEDNREELRDLLEEREGGESAELFEEEQLRREPVTEEVARQLFSAIQGERVIFDPDCYFWEIGNYAGRVSFPEHPSGSWPIETNAEGFRKSVDVLEAPPDLRVLVTGDSHTAGRVPNAEQFANLLEARLAAQDPARSVEALNGGKGAYSFYNYLGVLEKWGHLEPDVFVMAVYAGNDFAAPVRVYRYFNQLGAPEALEPRLERKWRRVAAAHKSLVTQEMNQVLAFAMRPEEIPMAEALARQATRAVRDLCRERGVRLIVIYIPTCAQVQPRLVQARVDDLCQRMELSPEDLARSAQVGQGYLDFLALEGIQTIDMSPIFAGSSEACYWTSDLHINTLGHELIAEALVRELR
jgi:lysophospholipase L1-like esterase